MTDISTEAVEALAGRLEAEHLESFSLGETTLLRIRNIDGAEAAALLRAIVVERDRLREAMEEVLEWIDNWSPEFTNDDEWPDTRKRAVAAIKGRAALQEPTNG